MTEKGTNIILIGMPGSGKSSIGRRIARLLGRPFIDSDDVLAAREGRSIGELSAALGSAAFVAREEAAVLSIDAEHSVIATGGSVIYGREAMRHLAALGTVVYLDVPYVVLERRVGDLERRGVVLPGGQSFRALYHERVPRYRRHADLVFRGRRATPNQTAWQLTRRLMEALPTLELAPDAQPPRPRAGRPPRRGSARRPRRRRGGQQDGKQKT